VAPRSKLDCFHGKDDEWANGKKRELVVGCDQMALQFCIGYIISRAMLKRWRALCAIPNVVLRLWWQNPSTSFRRLVPIFGWCGNSVRGCLYTRLKKSTSVRRHELQEHEADAQ